MMTTSVVAQVKLHLAAVREEGRSHFCRSCGGSATESSRDGPHCATGIVPPPVLALRMKDMLLCGCKHAGARFDDGAHTAPRVGSSVDNPGGRGKGSVSVITERAFRA